MENNSIAKSNQSIREIMKMARESYNTSLNQTASLMEASYKIAPSFLTDAAKWSTEDFDTMTEKELQKIYDEYFVGSEESKLLQAEDIRKDLKACKGLSNSAYEMKKSFKEVQDLYNESVDEDWKRRNSKEYRDATLKRISDWKAEIEKMDPVKDAKLIRDMRQKIEFMESTITLDFITERIKHVEREKSTIMRQFFSEREGSYSLDRCKSKSPKFGFDKDWYKFFFNLEENFLPEEYHAFNNLFLFNVMRFIGYQDPYNQKDRGMVQAIVSSLTGLVYHKFADTEMENVIISLIKDYDSYFEDQREKFMNDNTTRPNHPVRLEQSKKADADRRNDLFAGMVKFGFDIPENATEMSTHDLQEYFNNKMEDMVSKNTVEKELHGDAESTEEDGVTKIRPTFLKDKYRNPVDLIDGKFYYFNQDEKGQDSYKKVLEYFKAHDCTIGYQMFELKNPDVRTDVFAEDLTDSEKQVILEECKWNFWFFWRYVMKRKVNVNSLLTIDSLLADHNTLEETMRQSGKSTTSRVYSEWASLFHKDHYPHICWLTRDTTLIRQMMVYLRNDYEKLPSYLYGGDYDIKDIMHPETSIEQLVSYITELQDNADMSADARILTVIDDFELVHDIENIDKLKELLKLPVHIVANSIPNDPENIPNLIQVFQKDRDVIFYPYQLNKDTHCDFFTAVKQHNFQDTNAIAYITVWSKRLRTNEEIAQMVSGLRGPEMAMDGFLVREVWCKHMSEKFVQFCKTNGIDLTAEGYDPFISDTFRTEDGKETKSITGDAGQIPATWRSDDSDVSALSGFAYVHKEPASTDAHVSSRTHSDITDAVVSPNATMGAALQPLKKKLPLSPTLLKDKYRNPVDLIDGKYYYFNQDDEGQESYQNVLSYFKAHGCTIAYQMFELKNPDVRTDVFAEDLTDAEKRVILEECKWNFWFFWRYVIKLQVNVNTLLTIDSMLADHNTLEETVRHSGKTTTIAIYGTWALLFHKVHYPEIAIINKDLTAAHSLSKKMEGLINQPPKFIKDYCKNHINGFNVLSFISISKAVEYFTESDKISESNPALVIIDNMEYIEDINNVEDLKALTNLNVHLVMASIPNDPDQVPALMESFRKDPELIYNPYEINNATLRDFHTAVAIHNFKDTNAIAYITVCTRRLRTSEEIAAMVNGIGESTDGAVVRSVWCKHVNDKIVRLCITNGIDLTAEGYDPFITDAIKTVDGKEIKSIIGDAGQLPEIQRSDESDSKEPVSNLRLPSSLVDQLKAKMDTEGTYRVDVLTGEPVYVKPAKKLVTDALTGAHMYI